MPAGEPPITMAINTLALCMQASVLHMTLCIQQRFCRLRLLFELCHYYGCAVRISASQFSSKEQPPCSSELCWHKLVALISPRCPFWASDDGIFSASAGTPAFCSELFVVISPQLASHTKLVRVRRALLEWHRVLKPGGHLIVSGAHHAVTAHMPAPNLVCSVRHA